MIFNDPLYLLYLIPTVLISLTFHEFSHAYVSYRLGDPTAKNAGRLTLNPLKHLDPLGTLMFLFARVGWAKPVPIRPNYYNNIKMGTLLVSIAGPFSNVLLALIAYIPYHIIGTQFSYTQSIVSIILYNFFGLLYIINISLAAFNILPVPPLDGSRILSAFLPSKYYYKLIKHENVIGLIFLAIIFINSSILLMIISPVINVIDTFIKGVVGIFI